MLIFISHSSKDDEEISRLAADLRSKGLQTWVDHENLMPGSDWEEELNQALIRADKMIFFVTKNSIASKEVKAEWNYFLKLRKEIYPIIAEDGLETPFRLNVFQAFNLRKEGEIDYNRLLAALGAASLEPTNYDSRTPLLVDIPAGLSKMGSLEHQLLVYRERFPSYDQFFSETPLHVVSLPMYSIGVYPVTIGEYRKFIEQGGYEEKHYWTQVGWEYRKNNEWSEPFQWEKYTSVRSDRMPVVGVSWFEAAAYCRWLTYSTTSELQFRLPTEAEWEKAARGVDGRIFPWGNEWNSNLCNTLEFWNGNRQLATTTEVDYFPPVSASPYGVMDMAGNVFEWCQTLWKRTYKWPANNDPLAVGERIVRGGAYDFWCYSARTAFRYWLNPWDRNLNVGFRVATSHTTEEERFFKL